MTFGDCGRLLVSKYRRSRYEAMYPAELAMPSAMFGIGYRCADVSVLIHQDPIAPEIAGIDRVTMRWQILTATEILWQLIASGVTHQCFAYAFSTMISSTSRRAPVCVGPRKSLTAFDVVNAICDKSTRY